MAQRLRRRALLYSLQPVYTFRHGCLLYRTDFVQHNGRHQTELNFLTMETTHQHIVDIATSYVIGLYNQYDTSKLHFHNLQHTTNVVERVAEIAEHEEVTEDEKIILQLAAIFHDTGHLNGGI